MLLFTASIKTFLHVRLNKDATLNAPNTMTQPINYIQDLELQYEAVKKPFYHAVANKKAMNAGRVNAPLNEYLWHPSVFLPSSLWRELLEQPFLADVFLHTKDEKTILAYFANFMAHFAWRYSKSIYRFDEYCFDCLISSNGGRYIDSKLLTNLPEGSAYIDLTKPMYVNGQAVYGILAILNFAETTIINIKNRSPDQLIVLLNTHNPFSQESFISNKPQPTFVFDLSRSGKIDQQLSFIHGIDFQAKDEINQIISPFISLLSSLCVEDLELDNFSKGSVRNLVKTKPSYKDNEANYWNKGEYKVVAPTNPKNWRVGVTYGVNYRQARSAQQIEEQSKARLIGLHWTAQIVDFEIRLRLMPPKLSNESHIHEQIETFINNHDI